MFLKKISEAGQISKKQIFVNLLFLKNFFELQVFSSYSCYSDEVKQLLPDVCCHDGEAVLMYFMISYFCAYL